MTLQELNALDRDAAEREFLRCCGSKAWARAVTARRPFSDINALTAEADRIWQTLSSEDWLEAFASHPRIGESGGADRAGKTGATADWSAREQAGMAAADAAIKQRLASANHEYEARFGFIYIVCATGRTPRELVDVVEARLAHSRDEELKIAAEEQRKITALRLKKLINLT